MRSLGIHIRLNSTLDDACALIKRLNITAVQIFVRGEKSRELLEESDEAYARFARFIELYKVDAYVHTSYVINPARAVSLDHHRVFKREMYRAQRLGIKKIIMHPGSPDALKSRVDGIDALARFVNQVQKTYPALQLILENVAFKEPSLGGSFEDFLLLLEKVNTPEALTFCIDTAHAHVYGYNIITSQQQELFISHVEAMVGLHRVALLHINDTREERGSCRDKHAFLGQGMIGEPALRSFAGHKKLKHIPIIAELPASDLDYQQRVVQQLYAWQGNKGE